MLQESQIRKRSTYKKISKKNTWLDRQFRRPEGPCTSDKKESGKILGCPNKWASGQVAVREVAVASGCPLPSPLRRNTQLHDHRLLRSEGDELYQDKNHQCASESERLGP